MFLTKLFIDIICGNSDDNYEDWNHTSVSNCLSLLIHRFDVFIYVKYKKIIPISKDMYDHLDSLLENYIIWYKLNKSDGYIPTQGISPMEPVKWIEKIHKMNRQNKKLSQILKVVYKRENSKSNSSDSSNSNKTMFRISYKKLKNNYQDKFYINVISKAHLIIWTIVIFVLVGLLIQNFPDVKLLIN